MTGLELRTKREALGLSVNGLARKLGVAPSTVSRYENELIPIRAPQMIGLALNSLKQIEKRSGRPKRNGR